MGVKDAFKGLFRKQPVPEADQKPSGGEIGFTGNKIFAGLPMDEYNPDLAFPKSTEVYDQMRRSDGQISAVLSAMKLPIRSTKWYFDPEKDADDSKLAEQTKDFAQDNLMGGMKYSWDDHLREALTMLEFGFSVFEKVYKYETWNGRPVVMLDKYAPRVSSSIWRFPQDENYDIVQVEQINYMTGQMVQIPLNKCRVYTYDREGENIVGRSVLRPAYKHWYYKDTLYQIMAVGIEKTLTGTPYAKLPPGTSDEDREKVLDLLNAIRTSEDGGFTIPEDVLVEVLEGKKSPMDAMPFIEHHDTLIARSVLAQFINLGTMSSASGGSYALGNTMVDMFIMGLEAIANYVQGEIQKDVEELIAWNFGPNAPVPQLKHKAIEFKDMTQVAQALYYLGSGHLIEPDQDMENYIRDLFGIPPIPVEMLKNQGELPQAKAVPTIVPDEKITPTVDQGKMPKPGDTTPPKPPAVAKMEEMTAHMSEGPVPTSTGGEEGEPEGTIKWRRDLTPLEKTINLAEINDTWNTAEDKILKQMQDVMQKSSDQLIAEIQKILESGQSTSQKMNVINKLDVKFAAQYMELIKQQMKELYQYGAQTSAKELGTDASTVQAPQNQLTQLYAKAATLSNMQMNKMLSTIQLAAINQLGRGVSNRKIIHEITTAADAYIQGPGLKSTATITVGESINVGRGAEAQKVGVKGAQWSAILDAKTCPLCEDLDGKVIRATDPDFDIFRPPLHDHCRCILVYIGVNNTGENYDWVTPPAALVKKYGRFVT